MHSSAQPPHDHHPGADALWSGFERAFYEFLKSEQANILTGVSEQNLCGHLAHHLRTALSGPAYVGYFVDTEYNRKQGGQVKTMVGDDLQVIRITCDLIVHSRGQIPEHDNLIAVEMKKARHSAAAKDSDRRRLIALTRTSYDGIWSADGETLPQHVCGYDLGLLIEIDDKGRTARLEEYRRGELFQQHEITF